MRGAVHEAADAGQGRRTLSATPRGPASLLITEASMEPTRSRSSSVSSGPCTSAVIRERKVTVSLASCRDPVTVRSLSCSAVSHCSRSASDSARHCASSCIRSRVALTSGSLDRASATRLSVWLRMPCANRRNTSLRLWAVQRRQAAQAGPLCMHTHSLMSLNAARWCTLPHRCRITCMIRNRCIVLS